MEAVYSLPERNLREEKKYGLKFLPAEEAVRAFLSRTAGKVLILTDGFLLAKLSALSRFPRAIFALFDGDALPLFAMPDGIRGVIGAGDPAALRTARFFAELIGADCLILPRSAALFGALEREGEVAVDGTRRTVPLKESEITCDIADMVPSFSAAYGQILLARLARFERRMLAGFGLLAREEGAAVWEPSGMNAVEVLSANAALRLAGSPEGEGTFLAARCGEIAAYRALCAAYRAFFLWGKPRKYVVPDYRKRAERANVAYGDLKIPTPAELERRALCLEHLRSDALNELDGIRRADETHFAAVRALGGSVPPAAPQQMLSDLPETACGLLSVVRDFGLMEF